MDTFLEPGGHKAGCVEKAIICFCEGRLPEARCMGHEESKATANVKVASGVCRTGLQRGGRVLSGIATLNRISGCFKEKSLSFTAVLAPLGSETGGERPVAEESRTGN